MIIAFHCKHMEKSKYEIRKNIDVNAFIIIGKQKAYETHVLWQDLIAKSEINNSTPLYQYSTRS